MSRPVISVEGISKVYSLRHRIAEEDRFLFKSIFRRRNSVEEFWALRDIGFSVQKGDKVGIIGRNGAGKSTLLKILSRIVSPTSGRIEYEGRVASLLEVGTGFHPDLTGRENVFLNGSILGMSRAEISARFDEIVAFAEVENFLDTPVKRYSSGMYVRLAFAVAAHLEPEILIVDEVLAVGDAAFQKKCLGKMNDVAKEGRTILFVSHNMAALQNLCNVSLVLKNGRVDCPLTSTHEAVKHYIGDSMVLSQTSLKDRSDREGEGLIRLKRISVADASLNTQQGVHTGQDMYFVMETEMSAAQLNNVSIGFTIYSSEGQEMLSLATHVAQDSFQTLRSGEKICCHIKKFPLTQGDYLINMVVYKDLIIQDYVKEAFAFSVFEGDYYGNGRILPGNYPRVLIDNEWSLK